jgi:hypothetical protein
MSSGSISEVLKSITLFFALVHAMHAIERTASNKKVTKLL